MKKVATMLILTVFAVAPAAAMSKHHKKAKPQESVFAKQSANTLRILRNGLPLILPSWLMPVYFGMHMDKEKDAQKHSKKKM